MHTHTHTHTVFLTVFPSLCTSGCTAETQTSLLPSLCFSVAHTPMHNVSLALSCSVSLAPPLSLPPPCRHIPAITAEALPEMGRSLLFLFIYFFSLNEETFELITREKPLTQFPGTVLRCSRRCLGSTQKGEENAF